MARGDDNEFKQRLAEKSAKEQTVRQERERKAREQEKKARILEGLRDLFERTRKQDNRLPTKPELRGVLEDLGVGEEQDLFKVLMQAAEESVGSLVKLRRENLFRVSERLKKLKEEKQGHGRDNDGRDEKD